MANLLYLVHRLPYPPNKGDKVRSYHLLKHLVQKHRVFLATFVDDPADEAYIETVRAICPDVYVARLQPTTAKVRSLLGLLTDQALGLRYYQNAGLQAWVDHILARFQIDASVVFSSVMAQYVFPKDDGGRPPMVVDFVDVDSAKWTQYSANHRWPLSWLYGREGEKLLKFERDVAVSARHSFFVTDNEAALFVSKAPESASKVSSLSNGVDSDYFAPDEARNSPFQDDQEGIAKVPVVFTGAMDYWPNIDAVTWFVNEIMPQLRQTWPQLCFYIVGRSPSASVQSLACQDVIVTGTVDDVRPYLQHAAVVVAPLRIARGIQNKILEAMAMARPVVASAACVDAIGADVGKELLCATDAHDFVGQVNSLLNSQPRSETIGKAGRQRVLKSFSWDAHLRKIDTFLTPGRIQ